MQNSLVSIAMCTYNGAKFIKEQINSILAQTYTNFELVITDDGSTDDTIKIINEYIEKDDRIKLYQNKQNLGFVKNFEKAISLCDGEFIALADQDDIWKSNKLEYFLEKIEDNLLIYSDALIIDENSTQLNYELIKSSRNLVNGKCSKSFLLYNCVSGNTLMFKKVLIEDILPIPDDISYHDVWFAFVASSKGTIVYIEESMTYYRRYSDQVTATVTNNYKSFFDKMRIKEDRFKKNNLAKVKDFKNFRSVKYIDKELINLLDELIYHYEHNDKIIFNFKLYKLLHQFKDEIFAIKKEKQRNMNILKIVLGLKIHKILMFSM